MGNTIKEIKPNCAGMEAVPVRGRVLRWGGRGVWTWACPSASGVPATSAHHRSISPPVCWASPWEGQRSLEPGHRARRTPSSSDRFHHSPSSPCWALAERTHLFHLARCPPPRLRRSRCLSPPPGNTVARRLSHLGAPWEKGQSRGRWRTVIARELGSGAGRKLVAWGRVCPSTR